MLMVRSSGSFQEHGQGRLKFQEAGAAAGAAARMRLFRRTERDVSHDVNTVFLKAFIAFNKAHSTAKSPKRNAP